MPPAPPLRPGSIVGGKYRLVRQLGAGGMGEVWVAENRATGAELAVKMAHARSALGDSALRFRREARLGAMLAHRSVVRIYDLVEEDDGTLVLVMELLRGETLERYLQRRGPLPTLEAIAIAVPILAGLAHAHDAGIVHRDVTPANVFLAIDPDGHVSPKLLDFGLAKMPAEDTKHTVDGRALGTPRYMAPERIRERDAIDGRSDLFSVGVVVYELLTGVSPFAASTPAASLAAVLEVVVDPDPQIEPRVWLELRRALSKRAYERPATALAMADGLLAACGVTAASLSDVLRQAPLCRDLAGEEAYPGQVTRALEGHSMGGTALGVVPSHRVVLLVGALGVLVALGTVIGSLRMGQPGPTTAQALRVDDVPTRVAITANPPALGPVVLPPSPSVSASVVPAATGAPAHSAHPRRPRPVATTPGF